MPRPPKFSSEEILDVAFELVRRGGWAELTAAAIGKKLKCSTMPVFYHFENIGEIEIAVIERGWKLLLERENEVVTGDRWVDQAVGYARFAIEQQNLFHCMNDSRHSDTHYKMRSMHWDLLSEQLVDYEGFKGIDPKVVRKIRFNRAMFSHGIGNWISYGWSGMIPDDAVMVRCIQMTSMALLEAVPKLCKELDKDKPE